MADSITAVDFKSTMDKFFADFSFIKDEMATMKGDQSHLTVATNQLQTEKIELRGSDGGTNKVKISTEPPPPPPNPPTAVFSTLRWRHRSGGLGPQGRTIFPHPLLTFYVEGAA